MKKLLYYGLVVLVFTNFSFAESSWTDEDSANSDWGNPLNWSTAGNRPPLSSDSTFIRYSNIVPGGQGPLINSLTTAVCRRLSVEVNESGQDVVLTMTGGTLDIYYAGVNNVYFRLGAGTGPGTAIMDMSGGTMTVDIDANQYIPGSNGYIRVGFGYPGQLNMSGDAVAEAMDLIIAVDTDSVVDLRDQATIILAGDDTSDIQDYIDAGLLTAWGGDGMIVYDYDLTTPEKTTVRAISHNLNPSPPYGDNVATGNVLLSWTNFEPNLPGNPVYVDVWFGTDPNKLDPASYTKVLTLAEDTESVVVSAPVPGPYYWQVDSYIDGNTDPEAMIEGPVFLFNALNDFPPTVDAGPDMITWANQSVQLDAGLDDDGASTVTILWEADDPNAVFSDPAIENPTVSVNYPGGAVGVTVTVQDENNPPVADGLTVFVYSDACEAARVGAGLAATNPEDITSDCKIILDDFAALAAKWLDDYALTEPIPVP